MNVQKARSPSASRPWPPPAAARPGLVMAPRSASTLGYVYSQGKDWEPLFGLAPVGTPIKPYDYLVPRQVEKYSWDPRGC